MCASAPSSQLALAEGRGAREADLAFTLPMRWLLLPFEAPAGVGQAAVAVKVRLPQFGEREIGRRHYLSRRYERGSIIITSNRGFEQWSEILGDAMVAAALIDRLVHHATMITLKGKSYRLRERGLDVTPGSHRFRLESSARRETRSHSSAAHALRAPSPTSEPASGGALFDCGNWRTFSAALDTRRSRWTRPASRLVQRRRATSS